MKEIDDTSLLEQIFTDRECDYLCELSEEEMKVRNEVREKKNEEKLNNLIDKISDQKLADKIYNQVDMVIDDIMYQMGETLKKYYIVGFKDGVKLMNECLKGD